MDGVYVSSVDIDGMVVFLAKAVPSSRTADCMHDKQWFLVGASISNMGTLRAQLQQRWSWQKSKVESSFRMGELKRTNSKHTE